jgi:hypothetical protein
MQPVRRRIAFVLAGFGAIAAIAVALAPLVGSTAIHLGRAVDRSIPFGDNVDAQILFVARLPRTLAGALVGAALATAGVVFQGLLRNPLATPFTLGVSSGAALGAMLAITFGWGLGIAGISGVAAASFAGAAGAVAIVYALARARHGGLSTNVLLLAGVTLNAFFSALILFVQFFADFTDVYRMLRWLVGDLDVASYQPLAASLPLARTPAEPAEPRPGQRGSARHRRADGAACRVFQRLARDRRRGVGRRANRLRRHRHPASRAAARRRRPSRRPTRIRAFRRGVPGRVRPARADPHAADRDPGWRDHGPDRRAVLSMAAHEARVR